MKTKEILGILMLFLCTFSFISCDDDNEQTNELTPEALYQTSWRGTGHPVGFILFLILLRLHGYRKRKTQRSCGFFAVTEV